MIKQIKTLMQKTTILFLMTIILSTSSQVSTLAEDYSISVCQEIPSLEGLDNNN